MDVFLTVSSKSSLINILGSIAVYCIGNDALPTLSNKVDVKTVERFLEECMSKPPATVGLRIRPETELARLFGLGRWQMRQCLQSLVDKRIFVRRQGSGTFLRQIPQITQHHDWNEPPFNDILPSTLFIGHNDSGSYRPSPMLQQCNKSYRIGFWGNLLETNATMQLLLAGINDFAEKNGHEIVMSSVKQFADQEPLPPSALSEKLDSNHCDGYIVDYYWADYFLQTCGNRDVPAIFYWPAKKEIGYEPVVMFDTEEAAYRAVKILANEGFQRIALFSPEIPSHSCVPEQAGYTRSIADAGLKYNKISSSPFKIENIMRKAQEILTNDKPDALYVADDFMMLGVAAAFEKMDIKPGKDIGVIFQSNYGRPMLSDNDWSRMEFDPQMAGEMLVENLLRVIRGGSIGARNMLFCATWRAGSTHKRLSE